jgi:hypothetical protein
MGRLGKGIPAHWLLNAAADVNNFEIGVVFTYAC